MQALGVLERSPVPRPLEVPGDACRAFLLLRVELQGQVDRFFLGFRPGQSHGALECVIVDVNLRHAHGPLPGLLAMYNKTNMTNIPRPDYPDRLTPRSAWPGPSSPQRR